MSTKHHVNAVHNFENAYYTMTQADGAYEFEKDWYTIVLLYCEITTDVSVSTPPSTIGSVAHRSRTLLLPCTVRRTINVSPQLAYSILFLHFSVSFSALFLLLVPVR